MAYQSNPYFDAFPEAAPSEKELKIRKMTANRAGLAQRNVAAMQGLQPGGTRELSEMIANRKRNDYAAVNPDMARRFGPTAQARLGAQQADPYADTPADTARKEAMSRMVMVGRGARGVEAIDSSRTDKLAPIRQAVALGARQRQSEAARANALQMALEGRQRPTPQSNNQRRLEGRLALMQRMQMMQAAPQIAMIQAAHGQDPTKQAEAAAYRAAILEKLVGMGMTPQQAMNHPLMQPGQEQAMPPQAGIPGGPRLTPQQAQGQTLDNVPGIGPASPPLKPRTHTTITGQPGGVNVVKEAAIDELKRRKRMERDMGMIPRTSGGF